ncbi:MAG: glycosyltransferase [Bdellovibrionaceae bacterium]|nr:glycosyltransferase [Pseudobdellovibrionaceae bacterium]
MFRKILKLLSLIVLFFLALLNVVLLQRNIRKIVLVFKAIVGQFQRIIKNFCVQNPIFLSRYFSQEGMIGDYSRDQLSRLEVTTRGLYEIEKAKTGKSFFYSILVPVYKPKLEYFKILVESVLAQSVEDYELLIGFDGPQPAEIKNYIEGLLKDSPIAISNMKFFEFDRVENKGGISKTTNNLAKKASGNYLLLVDHDDWIRSDLLFRYDQILRFEPNPENVVLYCDEFKIDEFNNRVPTSYLRKADEASMPYLFVNWICHCLLVPRAYFNKIEGCRMECDGAQDYDLLLRLHHAGAQFKRCPVGLYAWRVHAQSTAKSTSVKDYASEAGLKALRDYVKSANLNWAVASGEINTTYEAHPVPPVVNDIHVVMPFKDQLEMTIQAVESLVKQKGVNIKLTLVNNRSNDAKMSSTLSQKFSQALDLEILEHDEPFNFSRICNVAARTSRFSKVPYILFMNNDVVLNSDAVFEMFRWMEQPKIGAVGCKLLYPDGTLQHGGIDCRDDQYTFEVCWSHTNYQSAKEAKGFHSIQRIVDAVTAACMLIRRDVFEKVGGFNEAIFPIAFSDTDLCARVAREGFHCFYNPQAQGVHFESKSRAKNAIEDFESSATIFAALGNVQPRKSFYYKVDN